MTPEQAIELLLKTDTLIANSDIIILLIQYLVVSVCIIVGIEIVKLLRWQ